MQALARNPLYDPRFEHDACGLGLIARADGQRSHEMVERALAMLAAMEHRGARGADPDTGESTVSERTLGLLPNPYERLGIKFAATYIGEVLGNATGGIQQGGTFEGRLNLAVDIDFDKDEALDLDGCSCRDHVRRQRLRAQPRRVARPGIAEARRIEQVHMAVDNGIIKHGRPLRSSA